MEITDEAPITDEARARTNRRTWLIILSTAGVVAVGVGVIVLSKTDATFSRSALKAGTAALAENQVEGGVRVPSGVGRALDHAISVQGHARQQAYGPGNSLRKTIQIAPHFRGPGIAA